MVGVCYIEITGASVLHVVFLLFLDKHRDIFVSCFSISSKVSIHCERAALVIGEVTVALLLKLLIALPVNTFLFSR